MYLLISVSFVVVFVHSSLFVVKDLIENSQINEDLKHAANPELYRSCFDDKICSLECITAEPHSNHFYTEGKIRIISDVEDHRHIKKTKDMFCLSELQKVPEPGN